MAAAGDVCAGLIRHKTLLLRELTDTNVLDVLVKKGLFSVSDLELITSASNNDKCNYFIEIVGKQSSGKFVELCTVLEKECPKLSKELKNDKHRFIVNDQDILEPTSPAPLSENVTAAVPLAPSPAPEPAVIAAFTSANSTDVLPAIQAMEHVDGELDPVILDILGSDPAAIPKYGADINKDLALRLNHMATSGLEKENRKQLIEKYLVPANCSHIGAPRLNAEIKAVVPDTVVKRDKAIESRQTVIAAAISCLGQTISTLLKDKDKNHELLKQLMKSERILCDIQYSESISRRNFALYSLKKDMKEQLANAKIDNFLFGADLPDTLRTAKAITKSSSDLKIEAPKKAKPFTPSAKNLNWKAGPGNRRAAPGPARRPPPPPAAADSSRQRPASSSRASSQRNHKTRNR